MPAWNSSSLSFSDGSTRHTASSLMKNTKGRLSKQHIMGKKMFGSRFGSHGKDLQIGKKFKKIGKGVGRTKSFSSTPHGGIGPSVEEFDDMLSKVGGGKKSSKKSFFNKKQFG